MILLQELATYMHDVVIRWNAAKGSFHPGLLRACAHVYQEQPSTKLTN